MQVLFKRWALVKEQHGLPVSVNPTDVTSTEFFHPAYEPRWEGDPAMPEATRITLRKGKEFFVQGSVAEVLHALNTAERQPVVDSMGRQSIMAKLPSDAKAD